MTRRIAGHCVEALIRHAQADDRVWLLDGDLADSYDGPEFARAFPRRFLMAGIAEQNMVAMAAGMAACGARPFVFSFAAFLAYRAADQIRVSVAQTQMNVALIASHAGGCGGRNGKTHQAISDIAVIGGLPRIRIWAPCDRSDVEFAIREILNSDGPSYLRAPRDVCENLPGQPGPYRWLQRGGPNLILCSGLSAHWVLGAARRLAHLNSITGVLHLGRLTPFPADAIEIVKQASRVFVVEDHVAHGGLGELVGRHCDRRLDGWYGWPAEWPGGSGSSDALRSSCGLDDATIAAAIADTIG